MDVSKIGNHPPPDHTKSRSFNTSAGKIDFDNESEYCSQAGFAIFDGRIAKSGLISSKLFKFFCNAKVKAIGQSGKKAVVYFHHHPIHYQNGIDKPFMEMEDAKQVLRILATQTHFVCFGHRHKTDVYSSDDIDADIDYILASGKTTERNKHGKFKFREGYLDVNEMGFSEILFNG